MKAQHIKMAKHSASQSCSDLLSLRFKNLGEFLHSFAFAQFFRSTQHFMSQCHVFKKVLRNISAFVLNSIVCGWKNEIYQEIPKNFLPLIRCTYLVLSCSILSTLTHSDISFHIETSSESLGVYMGDNSVFEPRQRFVFRSQITASIEKWYALRQAVMRTR